MAANLTAETVSLMVAAQINSDMNNGVIPANVRTFAELHDHVDANMYLLNVLEAAEVEFDPASAEQADLLNRATDMTSTWLARRAR